MNEVVNEVVAAGHPRHRLQLAARQQMGVLVVAARQQLEEVVVVHRYDQPLV